MAVAQLSSSCLLRMKRCPRGNRPRKPPGPPLFRCCAFPTDIVLEIASFLQNTELLNLSSTSSRFQRLLLPMLYNTVSLDSTRACRSGLATLSAHPELCTYIRTLVIRPNYTIVCWPRTDGPIDESEIAQMIEGLVDKLEGLNKLTWCGVALPPDGLWVALRNGCPNLKKIDLTAGSRHLQPESELLKFGNLTAFSLCLEAPDRALGDLNLPAQLWTMLTERCPNLEELSLRLVSCSHRLRELERLASHTFPHLRALQLEIWFYHRDLALSQPSIELVGRFLSAHQAIRELSIYSYWGRAFPETLPLFLAPTALPQLRSFVGVYQHVAQLPHPAQLETLDLTGDPVSGASITAVASALRRLTALQSLDVRLADAQDASLLQAIIAACPGLTTLRIMFPVNFGKKTLRRISAAVQALPRLRALTLYKGHRLTDARMLRCARALLAGNPSLQEIQLASFAWPRCERRESGSYFVLVDARGRRYVDAWERGARSVYVGGGVFERRFRYFLDGGWYMVGDKGF
ncbi:hypothetical protein B0H15DRAFT_465357 [Mycena belliarum]|uniref:F-box domain-containing protein n=1 Tax=Mycena belliarum TaxID=1033014 RepID=A0AAD6UJD4_9AGAR|nr:hypothetical protein B0H15DRAFT_465357 [Mycena belliae]